MPLRQPKKAKKREFFSFAFPCVLNKLRKGEKFGLDYLVLGCIKVSTENLVDWWSPFPTRNFQLPMSISKTVASGTQKPKFLLHSQRVTAWCGLLFHWISLSFSKIRLALIWTSNETYRSFLEKNCFEYQNRTSFWKTLHIKGSFRIIQNDFEKRYI